MPQLAILLLGSPRVECGGLTVRIAHRRGLALLAYLAVAGEPRSRRAISGLLWPDAKQDRADAGLRNLLWLLGRTPVSPWLEIRKNEVGLRQGSDLAVDVLEFRRLTAGLRDRRRERAVSDKMLDDLSRAAELYRDRFLSGFGGIGSLEFEEWQRTQEDALRSDLAAALRLLVRAWRDRGDYERSLTVARRLWSLDEFDEPALRGLLELYARTGQRGAAVRLYENAQDLFRRELASSLGPETQELYRRIAGGEVRVESALSEIRSPLHNLPASTTSFVGREWELEEIRRILLDPEQRLLTLIGIGGSGKTRLALQAARAQLEEFPDGVFYLSLADADAASFLPSLAEVVGLPPERTGRELSAPEPGLARRLRSRMVEFLAGRRLLIVLDNMENRSDEVPEVTYLLREVPGLKIMATSRVRLDLSGEQVLHVEGLPCPGPEDDAAACARSPAVRLLLDRARLEGPNPLPGPPSSAAEVRTCGRICQACEGHPLAIELAAGWAGTLTWERILQELESSADILTTRRRDVPSRHSSLRAVFEQTWSLLSRREQTLLARLSVFRGGFGLEAVKATAGGSAGELSQLQAKSVVRRLPSGRFELHGVLRQFAEERLAARPEEQERVLAAYSRYHLGCLAAAGRSFGGPQQREALRALAPEAENLQRAWLLAAGQGLIAEMRAAFRGCFLFYDMRSRFATGAQVFRRAGERFVEEGDGDSRNRQALRGLLMVAEGWFLHFESPAGCRETLLGGQSLVEEFGAPGERAFTRALEAFAEVWPGPEKRQRRRLTEALGFCEAEEDLWGLGQVLEARCLQLARQDPRAARESGRRSLEVRRGIGDLWGIALAHFILGYVEELRGQYGQARCEYLESMRLRRELGEDEAGVRACLLSLARVARRSGELAEAQRLAEEALLIARRLRSRRRAAELLESLGFTALQARQDALALQYAQEMEGLAVGTELVHHSGSARALQAAIALDRGDSDRGILLFPAEKPEVSREGLAFGVGRAWWSLVAGRLASAAGDGRRAAEAYRSALDESLEAREETITLETLLEVAALRRKSGDGPGAAALEAWVAQSSALTPRLKHKIHSGLKGRIRQTGRGTLRRGREAGGKRAGGKRAGGAQRGLQEVVRDAKIWLAKAIRQPDLAPSRAAVTSRRASGIPRSRRPSSGRSRRRPAAGRLSSRTPRPRKSPRRSS